MGTESSVEGEYGVRSSAGSRMPYFRGVRGISDQGRRRGDRLRCGDADGDGDGDSGSRRRRGFGAGLEPGQTRLLVGYSSREMFGSGGLRGPDVIAYMDRGRSAGRRRYIGGVQVSRKGRSPVAVGENRKAVRGFPLAVDTGAGLIYFSHSTAA